MSLRPRRSVARVLAVAIVCGVPFLLLAILVAAGPPYVLTAPSAPRASVGALGIGELEMGPDFGQPAMTPPRGPLATALLYVVLLLCPAKFILLWTLQRGESRQTGTPASGAHDAKGNWDSRAAHTVIETLLK